MSLVTLTDHDTIERRAAADRSPRLLPVRGDHGACFPRTAASCTCSRGTSRPRSTSEIQAAPPRHLPPVRVPDARGRSRTVSRTRCSARTGSSTPTPREVLLLFPTFEGVNGLTDARIEPDLTTLLERLTPDVIATLVAQARPRADGPRRTQGADGRLRRSRAPPLRDRLHRGRGRTSTPADVPRALHGGRGAAASGTRRDLNAMALCVQHTTYHHLKQTARSSAPDYRNPFVDIDRRHRGPRSRRSRTRRTASAARHGIA